MKEKDFSICRYTLDMNRFHQELVTDPGISRKVEDIAPTFSIYNYKRVETFIKNITYPDGGYLCKTLKILIT